MRRSLQAYELTRQRHVEHVETHRHQYHRLATQHPAPPEDGVSETTLRYDLTTSTDTEPAWCQCTQWCNNPLHHPLEIQEQICFSCSGGGCWGCGGGCDGTVCGLPEGSVAEEDIDFYSAPDPTPARYCLIVLS